MATSHTVEQRIPVMPYDAEPNPEIPTMITLITANAQLRNPRSLWFYEDESPGAYAAMRAVAAANPAFEVTDVPPGVALVRSDSALVVTVYPLYPRSVP